MFDSITLPANGDHGSIVLPIDAPAIQTEASVLTLGTKKQKQSIKAQILGIIKQRKQEAIEALKNHDYAEIIEKWAIRQLPYHPEIIRSKAHFNADLDSGIVLPQAYISGSSTFHTEGRHEAPRIYESRQLEAVLCRTTSNKILRCFRISIGELHVFVGRKVISMPRLAAFGLTANRISEDKALISLY